MFDAWELTEQVAGMVVDVLDEVGGLGRIGVAGEEPEL